MDRRTARTMATIMVVRKAAQKLNIADEDMFLFLAILTTSAETTTAGSVVAVAQAVMRAPPNVVEDLRYIIDMVKTGVEKMEADPAFMEGFTAKLPA